MQPLINVNSMLYSK